MKKQLFGIFGLLSLASIAMFSCSKSSSSTSSTATKDNMVGTWIITSTASDNNGNGVKDATEIVTSDTSWAHQLSTFNANGTFADNYYNFAIHGNWELLNNNTWVKITVTDTGVNYGLTGYSQILSISSTELSIKDTSGGVSWTTYRKQ